MKGPKKKVKFREDTTPKMMIYGLSSKGRCFTIEDLERYEVALYDEPETIRILVHDLFTTFLEDGICADALQSASMESMVEVNGRLVGESDTHIFIAQHMYFDGQAEIFGVPKSCILDTKTKKRGKR